LYFDYEISGKCGCKVTNKRQLLLEEYLNKTSHVKTYVPQHVEALIHH